MPTPHHHHHPIRILLAIVFATIAFTIWGFIWYATIFDDLWQSLITRSEDELVLLAEQRGFIQTIGKYAISLIQVVGIYTLIRLTRAQRLLEYLSIALICSLFIAIPALGNAVLFADQSDQLWWLDSGHFMLGYCGIALTFWIFLEIKT